MWLRWDIFYSDLTCFCWMTKYPIAIPIDMFYLSGGERCWSQRRRSSWVRWDRLSHLLLRRTRPNGHFWAMGPTEQHSSGALQKVCKDQRGQKGCTGQPKHPVLEGWHHEGEFMDSNFNWHVCACCCRLHIVWIHSDEPYCKKDEQVCNGLKNSLP